MELLTFIRTQHGDYHLTRVETLMKPQMVIRAIRSSTQQSKTTQLEVASAGEEKGQKTGSLRPFRCVSTPRQARRHRDQAFHACP